MSFEELVVAGNLNLVDNASRKTISYVEDDVLYKLCNCDSGNYVCVKDCWMFMDVDPVNFK